jgi:hypothetical protein
MKTAFAFGKKDRKTKKLVFFKHHQAPIAGPFVLKAIVSK